MLYFAAGPRHTPVPVMTSYEQAAALQQAVRVHNDCLHAAAAAAGGISGLVDQRLGLPLHSAVVPSAAKGLASSAGQLTWRLSQQLFCRSRLQHAFPSEDI